MTAVNNIDIDGKIVEKICCQLATPALKEKCKQVSKILGPGIFLLEISIGKESGEFYEKLMMATENSSTYCPIGGMEFSELEKSPINTNSDMMNVEVRCSYPNANYDGRSLLVMTSTKTFYHIYPLE